jgi:hypothetical protein
LLNLFAFLLKDLLQTRLFILPHGIFTMNYTQSLLRDMNMIRKHLLGGTEFLETCQGVFALAVRLFGTLEQGIAFARQLLKVLDVATSTDESIRPSRHDDNDNDDASDTRTLYGQRKGRIQMTTAAATTTAQSGLGAGE